MVIPVTTPLPGVRLGPQKGQASHEPVRHSYLAEAKFAKDERGASMVEYILLVALIALAVIAAVVFLQGPGQQQVQRRGQQAQQLRQLTFFLTENTTSAGSFRDSSPGAIPPMSLWGKTTVRGGVPTSREGARP